MKVLPGYVSSRRSLVLIGASLMLGSGGLGAQTQFRSWTTCSVGTIRACNSIYISTTPVLTGSTRTGTSWVIRLQNLQGTNPLDNTGGSVIMNAGWFYFNRDGSSPRTAGNGYNAVPVGPGASGSGFWEWESQSMPLPFVSYNKSIFKNPIQGCAQADIGWTPSFPASFTTCGPEAWIEFAFTNPTILDAEYFDGGRIGNVGIDGNAYECNLFGNDGCVLESTVTPEPATIVLMATGLVGLGGWNRRRRNKMRTRKG